MVKSYEEIAQETGTSIGQVRSAMNCAEKSKDTFGGRHAEWYVCAVGYVMRLDSYSHAEGRGETREEAVIQALESHANML